MPLCIYSVWFLNWMSSIRGLITLQTGDKKLNIPQGLLFSKFEMIITYSADRANSQKSNINLICYLEILQRSELELYTVLP